MRKTYLYLTILISSLLTAKAGAAYDGQALFQELKSAPGYNYVQAAQLTEEVFLTEPFMRTGLKFVPVQTGTQAQSAIDSAFSKIFRTPFKSQLCPLLGRSSRSLQYSLGVSKQTAEMIAQNCASSISAESAALRDRPAPKKYLFVTNIPANFPFDSWTTMLGNMTIVFFERALSEPELTARLVHELMVGMDPKIMIDAQNLPGLLDSYGYSVNAGLFSGGVQKQMIESVNPVAYPAIRFSLSTLRALRVERQMILDIFGPAGLAQIKHTQVMSLMQQQRFGEALRMVVKTLLPLQDFLLPFEYSVVPAHERSSYAGNLYLSAAEAEGFIQKIENSKLKFSSSFSGTQNLLEYLLTPTAGPEGLFFNRGPRPGGIGGGWSPEKYSKESR